MAIASREKFPPCYGTGMNRRYLVPPLVAIQLLLGACASSSTYPDLSRREAERVRGTALPAPALNESTVVPLSSEEIEKRVPILVANAQAAMAEFDGKKGEFGRIILANNSAPVASEGWTKAEVALAGLEATRSSAMISLAELDQLYAAERIAKPDGISPTAAEIAEARDLVQGWVDMQDREISGLSRLLAR